MTEERPEDLTDDELADAAADVLRPFTAARREFAIAALELRDLDAELARLIEDTRLLASTGLRDGPSTSFQVTVEAGPSRLVLDVEPSSQESVEAVVLVAAGPAPTWVRLRTADGTLHEASAEDWPLVFSEIRSTTTVRLEIGASDARQAEFVSPWIGL